MEQFHRPESRRLGWRLKSIVGGLAVSACLLVVSAGSAVPIASANYGCQLPPNGTCDSPINEAGYYKNFGIFTWDRAGCVRVIGYYGEPLTSWTCVGKQTQGSIYRPGAEPGYYRSSLKNNNTSYSALFQGYYFP
jgi:hypothetical protein